MSDIWNHEVAQPPELEQLRREFAEGKAAIKELGILRELIRAPEAFAEKIVAPYKDRLAQVAQQVEAAYREGFEDGNREEHASGMGTWDKSMKEDPAWQASVARRKLEEAP